MKYSPRAFSVSQEDLAMLDDIKKIKNHENISESFRFCVKEIYNNLMNDHAMNRQDDSNLMYRIYKAQIYTLLEIVKVHDGKKADSESAIQYFQELRQKIESK